MTERDDLDRLLATWLTSDAATSEPGHLLGQVLAKTAQTRRRPAWRIPERWIPMSAISNATLVAARRSWRMIGVAVLLILALIASLLIVAASQPRLPPPFGVAGNGSVAYGRAGDIVIRDFLVGTTKNVIDGPSIDAFPAFSMDGTRLAFLRQVEGASSDPGSPYLMDRAELWVASADGLAPHRIAGPFGGVRDYQWSPAGDAVALQTQTVSDGRSTITIVDMETGLATRLDLGSKSVDRMSWRPPTGQQIWFYASDGTGGGLYEFDRDIGRSHQIDGIESGLTIDDEWLAWSPDGTRVAFAPAVTSGPQLVIVTLGPDGERVSDQILPIEGGGSIVSPRFLPQGDRILFRRDREGSGDPIWTLNVVSAEDGRLLALDLGGGSAATSMAGDIFIVAPDGKRLLGDRGGGQLAQWVDLETGGGADAGFVIESGVAWQRVAP